MRRWLRPACRIARLSLMAMAMTPLVCSCFSLKKHVNEGEKVLNKNQFEIVMPDGQEPPKEIYEALTDMKKYTQQKPNSHVLGFGPRVSMRIYCLSNPKKGNFWHNYLRRKGQEPVIYDSNATMKTCSEIAGLLESKGCFGSDVTFDTVEKGLYDINVIYKVRPRQRYNISRVSFRAETRAVDSLLQVWRSESLLQEGDWYDQEKMGEERKRIVERLRNEGYYYASTDLITYIVDTAFDDHKLTIRLNLRNPMLIQPDRSSKASPLQRYRIDNILIYPNTSTIGQESHFDTLSTTLNFRDRITNYSYLYDKPMTLNPNVINRSLFLFRGQTFRTRNIERTYSSLLSLRNFKYIHITFSESPFSNDTNRLLDAKVSLLTAQRQRLSLSLELNNSSPFGQDLGVEGLTSGNFGTELKLSYQNKNIFGGAEQFKAEVSLLAELPKLIFKESDSELKNNIVNLETGVNLSIDFPTFLFPFTRDVLWQRMRPHTMVSFGANYQLHSYFERLLMNVGFGYNWHQNRVTHQLLPIDMTFVRFFNIDTAFKGRLLRTNDMRVKYQYSDHFIFDTRYDFTYNTQTYGTRNNFDYLYVSLESAGNLLAGLSRLGNGTTDTNGIRQIFGVPYSQYVRLTTEYKHYFYIGQRSTLVARAMVGIGVPYGNSSAMPYEKGFYGGGPTTLRAWHLRRLGPGLFQAGDNQMLERIGDIQLVMNLEHRFPLFSILEGALFADMGNVWLMHESEEFPNGRLKLSDLPKSIALGMGLGIRANISIVTVRLDLAMPFYDPGMESSARWRPPYWKLNQLTANFGIDYPF